MKKVFKKSSENMDRLKALGLSQNEKNAPTLRWQATYAPSSAWPIDDPRLPATRAGPHGGYLIAQRNRHSWWCIQNGNREKSNLIFESFNRSENVGIAKNLRVALIYLGI
jgi:hypothetical protein